MLKFSRGNAKLDLLEAIVGGQVWTFSLLSGHACPYAKDCLSKAIRDKNGKTTIQDGPHTLFRCFSASAEAMYPATYNARDNNTQLLRSALNTQAMAQLIGDSLPAKAKCIRIHVGGDFFNQHYFDAWMSVASDFPSKLFYAYTKSLPFWIDARSRKIIPKNVSLTASRGGYRDKLISEKKLRQAVVIADPAICAAIIKSGQSDIVPSGKYKGWEIDHDDSHAALPELRKQSFALLIHGTQPKETESAKAKKILNGVGSYSK